MVTQTRRRARMLALIPAYNESASLPGVIKEVREAHPDLDILVVDDGSTDGSAEILDRLDVRWLRFHERLGIGGAMRAGLRYAARHGYEMVVRIDGDGQHRSEDIDLLLAPLRTARADVVLGSRYSRDGNGRRRIAQRCLAVCLSALTRQHVTDPTSGFCAIGARSIRILAEHHPTGYPEPELLLFLKRNGLRVMEVPIRARKRLNGHSSLTAGRVAKAAARVLLAMVIVPLRGTVGGLAGD